MLRKVIKNLGIFFQSSKLSDYPTSCGKLSFAGFFLRKVTCSFLSSIFMRCFVIETTVQNNWMWCELLDLIGQVGLCLRLNSGGVGGGFGFVCQKMELITHLLFLLLV